MAHTQLGGGAPPEADSVMRGQRVLTGRAELGGRNLVGLRMKGKIGHALVLVPSGGWALPPGNVGGLPADIYRGEAHSTSRRSSPIVGVVEGVVVREEPGQQEIP